MLLVPNAALRFTPGTPAPTAAAPSGGSLVSQLMPRLPRGAPPRAGSAEATSGERRLWLLRDGGAVAVAVHAGLSDGRRTEVSGELREGEAVIVDQLAGPAR